MWQAFADMVGKWDEWGAASWTDLTTFTRKEEQLKRAPLVFAETRKYTSEELVSMSIEYANWLERGIFTPIKDPLYGELVVAQAQHKMTETPIRTKWVCRPVGYDNEHIYLKYMGFGSSKLKRLKGEP